MKIQISVKKDESEGNTDNNNLEADRKNRLHAMGFVLWSGDNNDALLYFF